MLDKPLIAVAIVTAGQSSNLNEVVQSWISEGFVAGETLFYCGPKTLLIDLGLDAIGIIDYVDPHYYANNFHINHKKHIACNAIDAEYIYLVHDRFIPGAGVLATMMRALASRDVEFGALDVYNEDGTPALRELRLRKHAASKDIGVALQELGRLVCTAEDIQATDCVAINGGQFFLHKSKIKHLARPLRWVEMEDDVLSHDLRTARGRWICEANLVTLMPRNARAPHYLRKTKLKYALYRFACNMLALLTGAVSCGQVVNNKRLERLLSDQFLLIDPLHKFSSSDFLASSLEKLTVRARLASDGKAWTNVEKHGLGWIVTGYNSAAQ